MSTSQRAVTPCGWRVKAGMVGLRTFPGMSLSRKDDSRKDISRKDVSQIVIFPERRFPDKTFPGKSFSRKNNMSLF